MTPRVWRVRALHYTVLALWLALALRLAYMQLIDGEQYASQARDNIVRHTLVPSARGQIFDRCGRVLAHNIANFVIKIVPAQMEAPGETLQRLAGILRLPPKEAQELFTRATVEPQTEQLLRESMDDAMLAKVAELQSASKGIKIEAKSWRQYPLGCVGAHVLGYVGEIGEEELAKKQSQGYVAGEWIGQDGLEYSQNSLLHGQPGQIVSQVDVAGQEIRDVAEIAGLPGSDLHLSIDAELQRQTELYLQEALDLIYAKNGMRSGGAVVALDPNTGFVRALASLPEYNPNWFSKGISSKRFANLINDKCYPLLNRAVSGAYPPGSTFKLVTTAAALQEGIINTGSWFYCPGVYYVSGLPFNCFVRTGHGSIDLTECIAESCDVAYYQMGCKLGLEKMRSYAHSFGVGEVSGIELPAETPGDFPYPGWKEKVFKESWFPGDNANTAIGQGFVTASPLQVALYTAAVANGGTVYHPQLIEQVDTIDLEGVKKVCSQPKVWHRVPVRDTYLEAIRRGMQGTVRTGTASKYSKGIDMAGKTGTAENAPSADNPYGRNHTWFTGFAPVSHPRLVVTVFLEKSGGYGGNMAAPVAFDVVKKWWAIQKEAKPAPVKPVENWR